MSTLAEKFTDRLLREQDVNRCLELFYDSIRRGVRWNDFTANRIIFNIIFDDWSEVMITPVSIGVLLENGVNQYKFNNTLIPTDNSPELNIFKGIYGK